MKPIGLQYRAGIVSLLFLFLLLLSHDLPGHFSDLNCWRMWSAYNYEHGLHNAYGSGTNYTPFFQYCLWLFGHAAGSAEAINRYIGYIRIFPLAFEFWSLWIVWRWMDKQPDYLVVLCLTIFNIAFSYNTLIWGVIDKNQVNRRYNAVWA